MKIEGLGHDVVATTVAEEGWTTEEDENDTRSSSLVAYNIAVGLGRVVIVVVRTGLCGED